jgi:hypothetical protein
MFATGEAPFGGGESYVHVLLSGKGPSSRQPGPYTDKMSLHIAFIDAASGEALGPPDEVDEWGPADRTLCCTPALYAINYCGPGVQVGGLILFPNRTAAPPAPTTTYPVPQVASFVIDSSGAGSMLDASSKYTVVREGTQAALIVACDARGNFALAPYSIQANLAFRNPNGFLPGTLYGFLPFYGVLFVAYLVAALVYAIAMCWHRKHLLRLQMGAAGLIVLGLIEMAVWFGTYGSKNDTGVPTPCPICPTTSDYIAAVVLSVAKRAVSRALLLAVALGYGVVKESLGRRRALQITALCLAYFIAGTLDEVEKETSYSVQQTAWEFPVFVVDLIFFIWTYRSLLSIQGELAQEGQQEKLRMYKRLTGVLVLSGTGFVIITLSITLITFGVVPLGWKSYFFLVRFWDLFYFLILLAVAWIWAPGPTSYQYSLYSQPPSTTDGGGNGLGDDGPGSAADVDDEEGGGGNVRPTAAPESVGIEMVEKKAGHATSGSGGGSGGGSAKAGTFVIEEEDEDDERDTARLPKASGGGGGKRAFDVRPVVGGSV